MSLPDTAPRDDEPDAPIEVLLVDDDPDWARFTSTTLEDADDRLAVRFATSASEGQTLLERSETAFDCVVCDYRMPEVDGLEFLGLVREHRPDLPFILITAQGSEDVASEAISAGVSDYLVKNPGRDQSGILATRIANAVEARRLREAVVESEERYRTVVEQSGDGIFILRDDRFRFVNHAMVDMTGYPESELLELDPVTDLAHPEDRTALERTVAAHADGDDPGPSTDEVRLVTADGSIRICEVSVDRITVEGEPAVLGSARDITERKRRERRLERERDLNQSILDILVHSSGSASVEQAFCEAIVDQEGFDLAWVGRGDDADGLEVQAWAGRESGYLGAVSLSDDDGQSEGSGDEPSQWALRNAEPQFVEELGGLVDSSWQRAATDRGYRALAALPLVYEGIVYGVLAVYSDRPRPFDGRTRELFEELAAALAYALASRSREAALTSDRVAEVTLRLADPDYYLVDAARTEAIREADLTATVEDSIPLSGETGADLEFVSVEGAEWNRLADLLAGRDDVGEVTVLAERPDAARLRVRVTSPTVGEVVADLGALLHSVTVERGGATAVLRVPLDRDLRAVVERFDERFAVDAMTTYRERDPDTDVLDRVPRLPDDLTDKQREAVRVAYRSGYFAQPRDSSADEVAEALGVSRSTFLQHLRVAQTKLFGSLFGEGE